MSSSKLSSEIQTQLREGGFSYWGPCGCTTPGEDWKDSATRTWNIRLYPSLNYYSIENRGAVRYGGKFEKLKQSLDERLSHLKAKSTATR